MLNADLVALVGVQFQDVDRIKLLPLAAPNNQFSGFGKERTYMSGEINSAVTEGSEGRDRERQPRGRNNNDELVDERMDTCLAKAQQLQMQIQQLSQNLMMVVFEDSNLISSRFKLSFHVCAALESICFREFNFNFLATSPNNAPGLSQGRKKLPRICYLDGKSKLSEPCQFQHEPWY